jgi:sRNA-binding protein
LCRYTEAAKAVSEDYARQLEERAEARETAARELDEAREEKERQNKELAARIKEEEQRRTAHKVATSFGGNLMNAKKTKEEASMSTVMKLTVGLYTLCVCVSAAVALLIVSVFAKVVALLTPRGLSILAAPVNNVMMSIQAESTRDP